MSCCSDSPDNNHVFFHISDNWIYYYTFSGGMTLIRDYPILISVVFPGQLGPVDAADKYGDTHAEMFPVYILKDDMIRGLHYE